MPLKITIFSCHQKNSCHFRLIQLIFFSQSGCRVRIEHQQPFWMTENNLWSHFSLFQINAQLLFYNKMENHFKFQSIRNFFSQNGPRRPFWMLLIPFLSISNQYETGAHFGFLQITFDHISPNFRSIRNFNFVLNFSQYCCHFGCPKIHFDRSSQHFCRSFIPGRSMATSNMKLMAFWIKLGAQYFIIFSQNGRIKPFCFSDFSQNR